MENEEVKMPNDPFYSEENAAQGGFFKFSNPGDAVKGTFVGRKSIPKKGIYPEQIGYELKTENGIVTVAFNTAKKFVHDAMKFVKLGQVVGFVFTGWFETAEYKEELKRVLAAGGTADDCKISRAKTIKPYIGGMDADYNVLDSIGGTEVAQDDNEPQFA